MEKVGKVWRRLEKVGEGWRRSEKVGGGWRRLEKVEEGWRWIITAPSVQRDVKFQYSPQPLSSDRTKKKTWAIIFRLDIEFL